MREVVFLPRANTDILAIAQYSKDQFGETRAKQYISEMRRQIELAAEFPGVGSNAVGLTSNYRKLRTGSHRAIYRYTDDLLIIVRILHEREDAPDDLEDFG
jgi:toxin ParE1/3/4